jgi:hypothetical protein
MNKQQQKLKIDVALPTIKDMEKCIAHETMELTD